MKHLLINELIGSKLPRHGLRQSLTTRRALDLFHQRQYLLRQQRRALDSISSSQAEYPEQFANHLHSLIQEHGRVQTNLVLDLDSMDSLSSAWMILRASTNQQRRH